MKPRNIERAGKPEGLSLEHKEPHYGEVMERCPIEITDILEKIEELRRKNEFMDSDIATLELEKSIIDSMENSLLDGVDLKLSNIDKNNNKLIHIAVKNEILPLVNYICDNEGDVNVGNNSGQTALHFAANKKYINNINQKLIVERLLEAGAEVNAQDSAGNTALHFAARNNNKEIVTLLLEAGANYEIKNLEEKTPISIALEKNYKEICKIFSELLDSSEESLDSDNLPNIDSSDVEPETARAGAGGPIKPKPSDSSKMTSKNPRTYDSF